MTQGKSVYEGSASRMNRRQRLLVRLGAPVLYGLARLLLASCRMQHIEGEQHLDGLLRDQRTFIPVCWHQRLLYCVAYLLRRQSARVRLGFIVSPSRDGELTSRIVSRYGARVIRGSATRTGARALRDLYQVIKEGVAPMIHPDGPSGPAGRAKPGSLMLAQFTGAPVLPLAFSADRYWQLGSWDRLIIPKPFARITLVIGEPFVPGKKETVETSMRNLERILNAVTGRADELAGASPTSGRGASKE